MFHEYPYTDFHELNLDWLVSEWRKFLNIYESTNERVDGFEEEIDAFKTYVTSYLDNLDYVQVINDKIDEMVENGTFGALVNEALLEYNDLVIFGDSWAAPNVSENVFMQSLATTLHANLINYASSGAGFVAPSSNLIGSQVSTYLADNTINKDYARYIIIIGGINDFRNNADRESVISQIQSLVATLNNACKFAKVLVVTNTQYPYTQTRSRYFTAINNRVPSTGNHTCGMLKLDGRFPKILFNTANYFHLTSGGQQFLAGLVYSALSGGELQKYEIRINKTMTNGTEVEILYDINDGVAEVDLIFTVPANVTSDTLDLSGTDAIPYQTSFTMAGTIGRSFVPAVMDYGSDTLSISVQTALNSATYFKFHQTVSLDGRYSG